MAGKYSSRNEFLPDEDSIGAYLERVVLYFKANSIEEDNKSPSSWIQLEPELINSYVTWWHQLYRVR